MAIRISLYIWHHSWHQPIFVMLRCVIRSYLVGGFTILKNMISSMGRIIPYIMENKNHVWNHQPDIVFRYHMYPLDIAHTCDCQNYEPVGPVVSWTRQASQVSKHPKSAHCPAHVGAMRILWADVPCGSMRMRGPSDWKNMGLSVHF